MHEAQGERRLILMLTSQLLLLNLKDMLHATMTNLTT